MTTKIQLPLLAAKLAANVARERFAPSRVTSLKDVPPSANALTNEWLTAALCRDVPGSVVVDFDIVGGSDGTSSRRAVRVDYNPAGQKAGLPTRLFTKSASSFQSRLMLVAGGVTESETIFYRDVRPQLDRLRSPSSYYATFDPKTYRSIVVMDDLSVHGMDISRSDAGCHQPPGRRGHGRPDGLLPRCFLGRPAPLKSVRARYHRNLPAAHQRCRAPKPPTAASTT